MAYDAKIVLDSISPDGVRLTTMMLTYPRFIHAELLRHRQLSHCVSSSRAIPVEKVLEFVKTDPAGPVWWGKNQKGMQAAEELTGAELAIAQERWLFARDQAVASAQVMIDAGVHKQICNRILEPWIWVVDLVSGTDWANFFALRTHKDAQPEFQKIARMTADLYHTQKPTPVAYGSWHLPFIQPDEHQMANALKTKVSAARCARLSYRTIDGARDVSADLTLFERLAGSVPMHSSPLEHVARPLEPHSLDRPKLMGNFRGWRQFRHDFPGENVMKFSWNPTNT